MKLCPRCSSKKILSWHIGEPANRWRCMDCGYIAREANFEVTIPKKKFNPTRRVN